MAAGIRDVIARVQNKLRRTSPYAQLQPFAVNDLPLDWPNNSLSHLFGAHEGRAVHKWGHYLPIYDHHLSIFRNTEVKVLELGVMHGGSLQLWRKYFGPEATIFGIDINPKSRLADDGDIHVRIGSQADEETLRAVVTEMKGVDVVIDDGSHIASHQRASFRFLFPLLSQGGFYVVEDLHTAYWPGEFEGGYRRRGQFIEEMKDLVDDMHHWYHKKKLQFPEASDSISAIHFYDSMVVIEKRAVIKPFHLGRGVPSF